MPNISGSVGKGGANALADVMVIQHLLNVHAAALGIPSLIVDGDCRTNTIDAIRLYQKRVLGIAAPDGRVDVGGRTIKALQAGTTIASPPLPAANPGLSGAAWWHANQAKFPNSNKLIDLTPPFRDNAVRFTNALVAAGAQITVSSTLRHPIRAYLMHFSWKIAKESLPAGAVPPREGVNIAWDHGNAAQSKKAAQEMVSLFGMAHIAALNSNHIAGEAIDMTISWTGTLNVVDGTGKTHALGAPRNGKDNTQLHKVGATYGVKKLTKDPPHWSLKGN